MQRVSPVWCNLHIHQHVDHVYFLHQNTHHTIHIHAHNRIHDLSQNKNNNAFYQCNDLSIIFVCKKCKHKWGI